MLLTRVFSLLFGTTLFVMIWSMQDGEHSVPRVSNMTEIRTVIVRPEVQPAVPVALPKIEPAPVQVVEAAAVAAEPALWMFADEVPQIAVK